mgnify:FL=1
MLLIYVSFSSYDEALFKNRDCSYGDSIMIHRASYLLCLTPALSVAVALSSQMASADEALDPIALLSEYVAGDTVSPPGN